LHRTLGELDTAVGKALAPIQQRTRLLTSMPGVADDNYRERRVASRRNVTGRLVVVPLLFFTSSLKAVGMWAKDSTVGNAAAQRCVVHGRSRCAAGASSYVHSLPGAKRPAPLGTEVVGCCFKLRPAPQRACAGHRGPSL